MELKRELRFFLTLTYNSLNRTFMELKLLSSYCKKM